MYEIVLDLSSPTLDFPSAVFQRHTKRELIYKTADRLICDLEHQNRKIDQTGISVMGPQYENGVKELVLIQSIGLDHRRQLVVEEKEQGQGSAAMTSNECKTSFVLKYGLDLIEKRASQKAFRRKLIFITDGFSADDDTDLQPLIGRFTQDKECELEIWGVDFQIPCGGDSSRPQERQDGKRALMEAFGSRVIPLTIESLYTPSIKKSQQRNQWAGKLWIAPNVELFVVMLGRIMESSIKPAVKRSKIAVVAAMEMYKETHGEEVKDKSAFMRAYYEGKPIGLDVFDIVEENAAEKKNGRGHLGLDKFVVSATNPEGEPIAEIKTKTGYRYGRDIVPLQDTDEWCLVLEKMEPTMQIVGFVPQAQVKRSFFMSRTSCVLGDPNGANSQIGFSALVRGMYELEKVALVRFVGKQMRDSRPNPIMAALIPDRIASGPDGALIDCCWFVHLPTVEDVRDYPFERLGTRAQDVSQEQMLAVAQYRVNMTLHPGDAPKSDRFNPEKTHDPFLMRYWDAVDARAMDPDCSLPGLTPLTYSMIAPDPNMLKRSAASARIFSKAFGLKKSSKRHKSNTPGSAIPNFLSEDAAMERPEAAAAQEQESGDGADVRRQFGDMMARAKLEDDGLEWFADEASALVDFVGEVQPLMDFATILKSAEDGGEDRSEVACSGMMQVIRKFVGPEGDAMYYDKALECVKALRKACLEYHMERKFNDFLNLLKEGLLFNGGHHEFWDKLIQNRVSLVTKDESNDVQLSTQDAEAFLSSLPSLQSASASSGSATQPAFFDDAAFDDMM